MFRIDVRPGRAVRPISHDARPERRNGARLATLPFKTLAWALLIGVAISRLVSAQATDATCQSFAPCKLSPTLPEGNVSIVSVSAAGRAVFSVNTTSGVQLYSVSVLGGEPLRISTPEMRDIGDVTISRDNRRVVYHARTTATGPVDLFSVPIGASTSSIQTLATNVAPVRFSISPDSRAIVYVPAAADRLDIVAIDNPDSGGRLTRPFASDGHVSLDFAISADSGSVVYEAPQENASAELYRVPLTLSPSPTPPTTKLNAPLAAGSVVGFQLAPIGDRVVYLASEESSVVIDLHSVRLDGSGRVTLNQPPPPDWGIEPSSIRVLPDASRVIYLLRTLGNLPLQTRLYGVPISGPRSANVRLDMAMAGTDLSPAEFGITGNSKHVVYVSVDRDLANPLTHWLFAVPVQGPASASTLMNLPSVEAPVFTTSPGGVRVAYTWRGRSDQPLLLFAAPVADPERTVRINASEQPVPPFLIERSGTRIVYRGRTDAGNHVFSAPADGDGTRYNLTASLGNIQAFDPRLTLPNGGPRVVYLATDVATRTSAIYSSPLTPP